MNVRRALAALLLTGTALVPIPAAPQSPHTGYPFFSGQRIFADDYNNIADMNPGPIPPGGNNCQANVPNTCPLAYVDWIDTSTSPATWRKWDGVQWIPLATINSNTHTISFLPQTGTIKNLVIDYGADPLGLVDAGPAFTRACAQNGSNITLVPAGIYWVNTPVVVTTHCNFIGSGWSDDGPTHGGSWVHINNTSINPFTYSGQGVKTSQLFNMGFYQDQDPPTPGWIPRAYPYVITEVDVQGEMQFNNLMFWGINKGIVSTNSGRFNAKHIRGEVYTNGISIDTALDVTKLDDIEWWPFATVNVANAETYVWAYTRQNTDHIISLRNDSPQWGSIFCFASRSCVKLGSSAGGSTTGGSIDSLIGDTVQHTLWVTGNNTDIRIANLYAAGNGHAIPFNSNGIEINATGATIGVTQSRIYFMDQSAVKMTNTSGSQLKMGTLIGQLLNRANDASPVFNAVDNNTLTLLDTPFIATSNGAPIMNTDTTASITVPGYTDNALSVASSNTYTITNQQPKVFLYSASGPLNAVTVVLPNAGPGKTVEITSNQDISNLGWNLPLGEPAWTLLGLPSSMSAYRTVRLRWTGAGAFASGYWAVLDGDANLTWTPGLKGSTVTGAPTYTLQVGRYKFDKGWISAAFNMGVSATGGMTGNISLTGLPLMSQAAANNLGSCYFGLYSGVTFTAGYTQLTGSIPQNNTTVTLTQNGSGVTQGPIAIGNLTAPVTLSGICHYYTNN